MRALLVFVVCLTIPMGVSAKMVSFDQHVFDGSTVTGFFGKAVDIVTNTRELDSSETDRILFKMFWGHGESACYTCYLLKEKYTDWKDMIDYSKNTAAYLENATHLDVEALLKKSNLSLIREVACD